MGYLGIIAVELRVAAAYEGNCDDDLDDVSSGSHVHVRGCGIIDWKSPRIDAEQEISIGHLGKMGGGDCSCVRCVDDIAVGKIRTYSPIGARLSVNGNGRTGVSGVCLACMEALPRSVMT